MKIRTRTTSIASCLLCRGHHTDTTRHCPPAAPWSQRSRGCTWGTRWTPCDSLCVRVRGACCVRLGTRNMYSCGRAADPCHIPGQIPCHIPSLSAGLCVDQGGLYREEENLWTCSQGCSQSSGCDALVPSPIQCLSGPVSCPVSSTEHPTKEGTAPRPPRPSPQGDAPSPPHPHTPRPFPYMRYDGYHDSDDGSDDQVSVSRGTLSQHLQKVAISPSRKFSGYICRFRGWEGAQGTGGADSFHECNHQTGTFHDKGKQGQ